MSIITRYYILKFEVYVPISFSVDDRLPIVDSETNERVLETNEMVTEAVSSFLKEQFEAEIILRAIDHAVYKNNAEVFDILEPDELIEIEHYDYAKFCSDSEMPEIHISLVEDPDNPIDQEDDEDNEDLNDLLDGIKIDL